MLHGGNRRSATTAWARSAAVAVARRIFATAAPTVRHRTLFAGVKKDSEPQLLIDYLKSQRDS
jgi:hypothetical protein